MNGISRVLVAATLGSLIALGGCSSDDTPAATNPAQDTLATTSASAGQDDRAMPTECSASAAGDLKTVTINVDDHTDGFGSFGLRTPSPLEAGMIRLMLDAAEDNPDPVSVTVASAGATAFEFVQVEAGVSCAADLELAAGEYVVTFLDKSKTFTVVPQS